LFVSEDKDGYGANDFHVENKLLPNNNNKEKNKMMMMMMVMMMMSERS
jgi:hypothetical protein